MGLLFSRDPLAKVQKRINELFGQKQYVSVPPLASIALGSVFIQVGSQVPQPVRDADLANFLEVPQDVKSFFKGDNRTITLSEACNTTGFVNGSISLPVTPQVTTTMSLRLETENSYLLSSSKVYDMYFRRPRAVIEALQQTPEFNTALMWAHKKVTSGSSKPVKFLMVVGVVQCEEGIYAMSNKTTRGVNGSLEIQVMKTQAGFQFELANGITGGQVMGPNFTCGVQYEEVPLAVSKGEMPSRKSGENDILGVSIKDFRDWPMVAGSSTIDQAVVCLSSEQLQVAVSQGEAGNQTKEYSVAGSLSSEQMAVLPGANEQARLNIPPEHEAKSEDREQGEADVLQEFREGDQEGFLNLQKALTFGSPSDESEEPNKKRKVERGVSEQVGGVEREGCEEAP